MEKVFAWLASSLVFAGFAACAHEGSALRPALLAGASIDRSALHLVGHEPIAPDPTIRRYTGKVTALGTPDAQGKVYSFSSVPIGPRNFPLQQDDLRNWRMTVLSGKRFGTAFRVDGNRHTDITVKADNGPVDGLAVNDVFVIESIDENGVSMFTTPAPPPTAAKTAGNGA